MDLTHSLCNAKLCPMDRQWITFVGFHSTPSGVVSGPHHWVGFCGRDAGEGAASALVYRVVASVRRAFGPQSFVR